MFSKEPDIRESQITVLVVLTLGGVLAGAGRESVPSVEGAIIGGAVMLGACLFLMLIGSRILP